MRFDVPVIGVTTIEAMARAGATCLAIESGRTLLFDSAAIVAAADEAGIAIVAQSHQIGASEAASAAGPAETVA
jgi:hypothetical protein